jgi:hypothetical protein
MLDALVEEEEEAGKSNEGGSVALIPKIPLAVSKLPSWDEALRDHSGRPRDMK